MASRAPDDRYPGSAPARQTGNGQSANGADGLSVAVAGSDVAAKLKRSLHQQLLAAFPPSRVDRLSEQELHSQLSELVDELATQNSDALEGETWEGLVDEVLVDLVGFGPLSSLARDHEISDILVNGPRQVFFEKRGQLFSSDVTFRDDAHLMQVVRRLVAPTGRQVDATSPMLDAQLPDGSRLNVVLKPPALNGPLVSIRRFGVRPLAVEDLIANGSIAKEMLEFLTACVRARVNMAISGGTGSGKTTLLNALSRFIPATERVVTIEDTAELQLQQPHVAKMESQPAHADGQGAVTMRDLVHNALRMRPDRIIVGECRGAEALEMLQAMNTGHAGSLTTVHANSTREAATRIELMIGLGGIEVPLWALRKLIASAIHVVVQMTRVPGGGRKIMAISEITGMEGDIITMHNLFEYVQTGVTQQNVAEGFFRCTGIRPQCLHKLSVCGVTLPVEFFEQRKLANQATRGPGR